ncbi:hypothetical protein LX36DRAFT_307964 [Colletotrichum falcatum]|nr:hypothetical protein LX36DRAFT_307964 [Colletotrichum falcatum]
MQSMCVSSHILTKTPKNSLFVSSFPLPMYLYTIERLDPEIRIPDMRGNRSAPPLSVLPSAIPPSYGRLRVTVGIGYGGMGRKTARERRIIVSSSLLSFPSPFFSTYGSFLLPFLSLPTFIFFPFILCLPRPLAYRRNLIRTEASRAQGVEGPCGSCHVGTAGSAGWLGTKLDGHARW